MYITSAEKTAHRHIHIHIRIDVLFVFVVVSARGGSCIFDATFCHMC